MIAVLETDQQIIETSTTTGTGTYTLAGAHANYSPADDLGDGATAYFKAWGDDGWELFKGTFTVAGRTLTRDEILDSSNAGAAVDWPAGTRYIKWVLPLSRIALDIDIV